MTSPFALQTESAGFLAELSADLALLTEGIDTLTVPARHERLGALRACGGKACYPSSKAARTGVLHVGVQASSAALTLTV